MSEPAAAPDVSSSGPRRFEGRVCVVTGIASDIGEAVARRLHDEGGTVVGADLLDSDAGATHVVVDLTQDDQVAALYDRVRRDLGRLDVVYNNVGGQRQGLDRSALDTTPETWREVLDVNLTSVYLSCHHAVPVMLETAPRGGVVVNAASFLAAFGAATAMSAFAAAKAGVVQLSRDLGVHLARSGVRVNAVLFGPIQTPAQRAVSERTPGALEERMIHFPMGRFGTLEEAAGTVAFLASDDAGFVTASAIELDGGASQAFTVASQLPDGPR